MLVFVTAFVISGGLATLLIPPVIRVAQRFGALDRPNARKVHAQAIPRIGGAAIFLATWGVAIPLAIAHFGHESAELRQIGLLAIAAALVFAVGLADDVIQVNPKLKLLVLLIASIAVCASGNAITQVPLSHTYVLSLGSASWPISVLWICGVTTAVNFIDGLDGLAAGICGIAAVSLAVVAACHQQAQVAIVSLSLVGAICGFLFFNSHPARIFMGDGGSLFLGFMLGAGSLWCVRQTGDPRGFVMSASSLGVPILDALLTMVRRGILQRRSLFAAERGHVHHRLLDCGIAHRNAVLLLHIVTATCCLLGMGMCLSRNPVTIALYGLAGVSLLIAFFSSIGSLRIDDILQAIRRNAELRRRRHAYSTVREEMQLRFLATASFNEWWSEVCTALQRLSFVQFTMCVSNRDGSVRHLNWENVEASGVEGHSRMSVVLPIRQRREGGPLLARVEVSTADSLELAGYRISCFTRLIEEFDIASVKNASPPDKESSRRSFKAAVATVDVCMVVPAA